jgi:hypothetical protein
MSTPIFIDRYPGLRPFDEAEKAMFFGRSIELEELCQSINVNDLFVIHGESGLGKSSLINAGLIPLLREKGFYPILIRFKARNRPPLQQVLAEVRKLYPAQPMENVQANDKEGLWHLLKLFNKNQLRPVLIFDQFEEFSYFNESDRLDLIRELSALQVSAIPEYARSNAYTSDGQELAESATDQSGRKFSWHSQVEVKLIFSLRSDRIAILEEFATYMPGMMRARFQLKPILLSQAEQIIVIPAVLDNEDNIQFTTRPFQFHPGVIDDIIKTVSDSKRNTIETTQLQMICQEIELIVRDKQQQQEDITITRQDLGKSKLEEFVNNFYRKQLDKIKQDRAISPELYMATRVLIERRMLEKRTRIPLAEGAIFQFYTDYLNDKKVQPAIDKKIKYVRDLLLSLRLIRDQNYGGVVFYEISHDTLIDPIEKERTERETAERQKQQNEEKRKQESEITKQRKQIQEVERQRSIAETALHRARLLKKWIVFISGLFALICILLLLYYFRKNNESKDMLVRIYNYEADKNYQLGNHQLAYRYWAEANQLGGSDSIRNIMKNKLFGAFVGSAVQVSDNLKYVAVKDNDKIWHLWKAGSESAIHLRTIPAGFNFGFLPGSELYWMTDDSLRIAVYRLSNPMKKLTFKDGSVNLDSIKVGTNPRMMTIGNYLQIATGIRGEIKAYLFSLASGKPLSRINRYLDSLNVHPGTFTPRYFVPLRDDSSLVYFWFTRQPVALDLKNDRIVYVDKESIYQPMGYDHKLVYEIRNNIYVYNHQANTKYKVSTQRVGKKLLLVALVNKGKDVLLGTTENGNAVLYQVNISSGETTRVGKYYHFIKQLKDHRYYLYMATDSLMKLYDAEKKVMVDSLQGFTSYQLSPNLDKLLIYRDSSFDIVDIYTLKTQRTINTLSDAIFSGPSSIYYKNNNTLTTVLNYLTGRESQIPIKPSYQFAEIYGDRFISVRSDKSPFIYCLGFIDSSKRNTDYLQTYFDSYLKSQFYQYKK